MNTKALHFSGLNQCDVVIRTHHYRSAAALNSKASVLIYISERKMMSQIPIEEERGEF